MGVFLSSILVTEYEVKNVYVLFYYDKSTKAIISLFTHADQLKSSMPLFEHVCAFIRAFVSTMLNYLENVIQ